MRNLKTVVDLSFRCVRIYGNTKLPSMMNCFLKKISQFIETLHGCQPVHDIFAYWELLRGESENQNIFIIALYGYISGLCIVMISEFIPTLERF